MANIGEIEFLVRFDSMNTSFKKVLGEALENVNIGGGGDTSQKLDEIRTHLKALVVPYSGARALDEVRSLGHMAQLADKDFLERKTQAIASSKKALEKVGLGGMEVGAKETQDAVRIAVKKIHADYAKFIEVTMSSDQAYKRNYSKLQNLDAYYQLGTEGTRPYLIGEILKVLRPELELVEKWLETMQKQYGKESFKFAKGEAWWDKLKSNIGGGDKLTTQTQFYKAMIEHLDDQQAFQDIFFGGADLNKDQKDSWKDFLDTYELKGGEISLPRSLTKEAQTLYPSRDVYNEKTYFRNDMRMILTDPEVARVMMTTWTDMKEGDPKLEEIITIIEDLGYYFFSGEAKTVGSEAQLVKDLKRLTPSMREEIFRVQAAGEGYKSFMESLTPHTAKQLKKAFEGGHLERMVDNLNENSQVIIDTLAYLKGKTDDMPEDLVDRIKQSVINIQNSMGE